MNWEDILKEDSKKLDAINKVLHTFMVDIDSNIEILGLMPVPVVKDGPELIEAKKEILELSRELYDKIQEFLTPYFKRLRDE